MKNIVLIDSTLSGHHFSFLKDFVNALLQLNCRVYLLVPNVHLILAEVDNSNVYGFEYAPYNKPSQKAHWFYNFVASLKRFKYDRTYIQRIEKKYGIKVDLTFFCMIDAGYLSRYIPSFLLDLNFPYQWSTLYFHPYHLRRTPQFLKKTASWRDFDSIFLAKNCIGCAIHDVAIQEGFQKRISKPVIHFPETADDTPPDNSYPLALDIRKKAKDRIVVGMIGCEKHKGTLTLVEMAKKADASKYFFAFLGILPEATYTENEWFLINQYINNNPENAYFYFHAIPEGGAYNAVFCAFDIPFLVYDDFISSSNRLTKAAIFKKLVLSSDNYCVGDDVKNFELGCAVKPKSPEAAYEGLKLLSAKIKNTEYPLENWEAYKNINSKEILVQKFEKLLSLL